MTNPKVFVATAFIVAIASLNTFAAPIDEATALTAANRFLQTSKIAARTLPERAVGAIEPRGNLWVVALSPSGHILISGSDHATPIIGFSENNFSEGEENSPERAMLDAADAAVAAAEADEAKDRHERWDILLAEQIIGTRKAAKVLLANSGDIYIEPFVKSKYNQNQPWNDLTPVTSKDEDYIWRGRSCAGCVSIADAALFRELRWPVYPARTETITHNLRGESFAIRFDGSAPFDWDKMFDTYSFSGDMRGKTGADEDKRYEIGRYVLWLNQSASMSYNAGESTSTKSTSAHGCTRDWYTIGRSMAPTEAGVEELVTSTFELGIPVFVGVGGHAVVADGWQKEGSDSQVHLVYGYGGNASDTWYSLETGPAQYFWVDHYPRAKPQLDPIPRVVGDAVTLSWHFPDCYTNKLNGFAVTGRRRTSASLMTWTADFADGTIGNAFPAGVWSTIEDGGTALYGDEGSRGVYQLSTPLTVTADSVLSLEVRGDASKDNISVEICGDDGNWDRLLVPAINWAYWNNCAYKESSCSLVAYAGQTVQLRIVKSDVLYNEETAIRNFRVTNVIPLGGANVEQVALATDRNVTITNLVAGSDYAFCVTPVFTGETFVLPETSDAKIATVEGTHAIPGTAVDVTEDCIVEGASISFTDSFQITEDSQLSCIWYADCSAGGYVALKVTFTPNGGEEDVVYQSSLKMSANDGAFTAPESDKEESAVSLSEYAGVAGTLCATIYTPSPYAEYAMQYPEYYAAFTNLGVSAVNSIAVSNVKSCGAPEIETLTAFGMPAFTSIQYAANGGAPADLVDGYLADGSIGSSTLYVTTPTTVTNLTATPSHVELVKDTNVHVTKISDGNWKVTFDPVIPANRDRQRMILTLHATDTNGTTAHRDVVMRMTEDKIVVRAGENWVLDEDYKLSRSLVMAGGTVTANHLFAIDQNSISSFAVTTNSALNGTGKLSISNSNATITFENSAMLSNGLNIESSSGVETLTLAGTGTFVQEPGTTIKVYDLELGEHVLLELNLSADQSTTNAIVQFGYETPSIAGWKLKIDAPADMPKGTYPLVWARTYLSMPNTIYLPSLQRECSVVVSNNNTLCFVVGDPITEQFTDTDYPVPYSWIATYVPGIPESFMDQFAKMGAANGENKYWECYVLGLNPTNANDTFAATLTMNGTTPVVAFSPTNETLVSSATMPIAYVLQGNVSAEGGEWVDTSFAAPGANYERFRVDVRWTNGEVKHIYSNVVDKPVEPVYDGPAPIAVWNRDFWRTVEGCALDRHGNTVGADGMITINTTTGNEYQGVDVNLASGTNAITVIVKYSGLSYSTDNGRMVFTSCAESTKTTDRTAVRLTTGNALSGSWGNNSGVAENGTSSYPGSSVPASSGYMVFCYGNPDDANNRGTLICSGAAEGSLNVTNFWHDALKFSADCDNKTICGATIGGYRKYSTSNGWKNATGMKIEAIAVFGARLTEAERNAYRFPAVTETDYPVPYSWFSQYNIPATAVETVATNASKVAKGGGGCYSWWECYVLGLDPTNETSKFLATIRMEGQRPVVEYSPTNTALGNITYVLQGKPALSNGWQDVEFDEPGDTNRFFRVKVTW